MRVAAETERDNVLFRCAQRAASSENAFADALGSLESAKAYLLSPGSLEQDRFKAECERKLDHLWEASNRIVALASSEMEELN